MKSRRIHMALAVAMSGALVLGGCAGNGGSGEPKQGSNGAAEEKGGDASKIDSRNTKPRSELEEGGTVTFPMEGFPTNFNKWHVDGNMAAWGDVINATDPGLYLYSPTGEITPRTEYLMEMPKVEDKGGKETITYKLNPKAVWNDGTKIDWKSFDATWKANRAPVDKEGFNNIITAGYEDIEKVEQGTTPEEVVVTMKKKFYPATEIFGSLIHPKLGEKGAFNTLMKTEAHSELRSGPYKVDKIDKQAQTIVLKPNEKWWGEKPLLSEIVFRQMEPSAEIPAFKNGEIDVVGVANNARLKEIQGATNMELRRSQRLSTGVYVFNSKAPSLADENVRKAIWQGINREELKQVRFNGLDYTEKPVGSALFFAFQDSAEDNMPVTFDKAAAEKTLQDAGYTKGSDGFYAKDGKKLTVKYTTFGDDPMTTSLAQTVQNQLKAVGIDLQIDVRPGAAFGEAMEKQNFDFLSMAWSTTSTSPVTSVCQFYCSDSTSNYAHTGNKELDARIKKIGEISDVNAQNKEINAIEKEWMKTYGQMPLWNGPVIAAYRPGLANYGPGAFASVTPKWEDVGWVKGSEHN